MKTIRIAGISLPVLPARLWVPLALAALAAGAYFGLWRGWLRDYVYPRNWGVVEAGKIYRSGMIESGLVRKTLAENGIRVVIQMNGWDPADPKQVALAEATEAVGAELLRFPMAGTGLPKDGVPLPYAQAVAAIKRARDEGKPVLVQCSAGAYRTGGVVATYRLLVEKAPPEQIYRELVRYKWDPGHPQLLDWMNARMPEIAAHLAEMSVIERVPEPIPTLGPP